MRRKTNIWKILFFLLLIGLGVYFATTYKDKSLYTEPSSESTSKDTPATTFTPPTYTEAEISSIKNKLKSLKLTVPDSEVKLTLKDGESDFTTENDSDGFISLTEPTLVKELYNEDQTAIIGGDVFAPFSVNTGGAGTFSYIVMFSYKNGVFTQKGSYYLGEGILVTDLETESLTSGYTLSVQYLSRLPDEPLTEDPTHPKQTTLTITNGTIKSGSAKTISL